MSNGTLYPPADMRDIKSVRNALGRVEDKVDAMGERLDTSLRIQAAIFSELTGRELDSIPGIGTHAAREGRRQTAIRWTIAALGVALIAFAFAFAGTRAATAGMSSEVHHVP